MTREGKTRWLEPGGSTASTLQIALPRPHRGGKVVTTVRDHDWILESLTYTLENQSTLSLGIGEAEIVEKLAVLSPDGKTTLFEGEKLAPNEPVIISLPEAPARPAIGSTEAKDAE